jgi:hypothetical protein
LQTAQLVELATTSSSASLSSFLFRRFFDFDFFDVGRSSTFDDAEAAGGSFDATAAAEEVVVRSGTATRKSRTQSIHEK